MLGKRLRELRTERNLNLEEVAKEIDVSTSTYAGYETYFRKPPIQNLIKLSNFYDVSVDYLIGLTDERNIKHLEYNTYEYLKKDNLNWNGVPLTKEELKPINDLLEVIVRDRLPKDKQKDTD